MIVTCIYDYQLNLLVILESVGLYFDSLCGGNAFVTVYSRPCYTYNTF